MSKPIERVEIITGIHRRVTALLNRTKRSAEQLNHKRVFRLMRQASLLLQPYTGRRAIRAHGGKHPPSPHQLPAPSSSRWSAHR